MITRLIYMFLVTISKLSLETLYSISKYLKYFNKMTFNYRKIVVAKNIQNAFPHMNNEEQHKLIDKFYTFFFDNLFEMIKIINLKDQEILQRITIINEDIIHKSKEKKHPIILTTAHYGNWEWAFLRISLIKNINLFGVYKPLSNHFFNIILLKIRRKFGGNLISLEKWKYFILKSRRKPYTLMFISDQIPSDKKYGKRFFFLNQETLFHEGAEKTAKLLNADVFYVHLNQVKKGKYTLEFQPMTEKNITQQYTQILEKRIKDKPEYWLWSHNRWKR